MEARNDTAGDKIRPYARPCSVIWIFGQEVRRVIWIRVFEELAQDGRFVERFAFVLECWDKTAGVESHEGVGLVVGIDYTRPYRSAGD